MSEKLKKRASNRGRHFKLFGIWLFPYGLAIFALALSYMTSAADALRSPVLAWPVEQEVFGWLLIMVIVTGVWFLFEFSSAANRETIVVELQIDAAISTLTACIFTGVAGVYVGYSSLAWWIMVPWLASLVDAVTSAWFAINNAAQKPFLSDSGTM